MLVQRQRPVLNAKAKPIQRRPPNAFLNVISSREEAKRLNSDIEGRKLFNELLTRGVIRKAHFKGLIPQDKYLSHRLKEAIAFINRYRLDSRAEWTEVFNSRQTEEYINQLAQRWKLPTTKLRRLLRLLSTSSLDNYPAPAQLPSHKAITATNSPDVDHHVETIASFVSRHGINQQDFVNYIMTGGYDAQGLAKRFGCQVAEAETVLKLVSHLEIVDAFREETSLPEYEAPVPVNENIVAEVRMTDDLRLQVRFIDKQASALYLIDYEQLELFQKPEYEQAEVSSLMQAIHVLNERSGALANIVQTICSMQMEFIASADLCALSPVSQSEIAYRVGHHRSVVSRLIRGQRVLISNKTYSLAELMPRTKEVIARLIQAHPDWTDSQLKQHLEKRFNVQISQRAVNYHRHALTRNDV
jgi:transposase